MKHQTPNTENQRSSKLQSPNSKESSNPKFKMSRVADAGAVSPGAGSPVGGLELGIWKFFGVWSLEFAVLFRS